MTLQLHDIHVTVADGPDRLTILNETTLAVESGELIAVTGVSGSGKSTLVAVAGLLRRPDQGQVLIDGEGDEAQVYILFDGNGDERRFQANLIYDKLALITAEG